MLEISEAKPYITYVMAANRERAYKIIVVAVLGRIASETIHCNDIPFVVSTSDVEFYIQLCKQESNGGFLDDVDVIIPMPSSSNINAAMVNCINRNRDTEIVSLDLLSKQSVDSVYKQIDEAWLELNVMDVMYPTIERYSPEYNRKMDSVYNVLMRSKAANERANLEKHAEGNPFAIKYVPVEYRDLFENYIVGAFPDGILADKKVLVVDDSIASGKSIRSIAERFILPQNPKRLCVMTLLSPLLDR